MSLRKWIKEKSDEARKLYEGKVVKFRKIEPMLAERGSEEDIENLHTYWEQRKFDGTRTICIKVGDNVELWGRTWKNNYAPLFPEIVNDIRKIPVYAFILDGELTFFKKGTDKDVFLSALAKPETKQDYEARYMVFDVLYVGNENVMNKPFEERLKILKTMIGGIDKKLKHLDIVKTVKKGKRRYYEILTKTGGEGVVLKERASPYREGIRSDEWLKVKKFRDTDAVIVGYTKGKGEREKTFGALVLAQYLPNGELKYIGKTSGFTDRELVEIKKLLDKIKTKNPPIKEEIKDEVTWVKPKYVVTVRYYERSKNGVLRFPVFEKFRFDKKPKECIFGIHEPKITKIQIPREVVIV